jgi:hypothetical protein
LVEQRLGVPASAVAVAARVAVAALPVVLAELFGTIFACRLVAFCRFRAVGTPKSGVVSAAEVDNTRLPEPVTDTGTNCRALFVPTTEALAGGAEPLIWQTCGLG